MIVSFNGVGLEVSFSYYPATRGHRDKWGAPEEPDEDASIEINSIEMDGQDVTELCEAAGIMDRIETIVWIGMAHEVADYD